MEMTAAIKALEALPPGLPALVHSDSQYVVKGIREWLPGWKRRGWRTAGGEPVKNQSLWETLDRLNSGRQITWQWVRGHAGHEQNEHVDGLANAEAQKAAMAIGFAGRLR
jgi:ribonuclease HI